MRYSTLLFDFDGTLFDSSEGIINGVKHALRHFEIEEDNMDTLHAFIGPPLGSSFSKHYGLGDTDCLTAVLKLREYYSERGVHEVNMYRGVDGMLQELEGQGRTLAIATSKPTYYASQILDRFALDKHFRLVQGSEMNGDIFPKDRIIELLLAAAPDWQREQMLMVGDTTHDILGARKHGIPSVGVLYGFGRNEDILDAQPDYVVETVDELRELLLAQ